MIGCHVFLNERVEINEVGFGEARITKMDGGRKQEMRCG